MATPTDPYAAFRIDLDEQRARAAARVQARHAAGEIETTLRDAQKEIASELGVGSWHDLGNHVVAMHEARSGMGKTPPPDAGPRTLHIRCGSDIQPELATAGFTGDFLALWDWLPVGPVTNGPDWIEQRARFHASVGTLDFNAALQELGDADDRLARSATEYERVVIWMEHDSHDQLATVRCLARYARTGAPRVLDLISVNRFPGSVRFIGLGQLPPEAMRLLWQRRWTAGEPHLQLAAATWRALTSDDPQDLAALLRTGTPALPHLAPALHRHLRELPARTTGLGLTQALILASLTDRLATVGESWRRYAEREPLPFLTDTMFAHLVAEMARTREPLVRRRRAAGEHPFRDDIALTVTGAAVLRGEIDAMALDPPPRWVGGVAIRPGAPVWRWDDERRAVMTA